MSRIGYLEVEWRYNRYKIADMDLTIDKTEVEPKNTEV